MYGVYWLGSAKLYTHAIFRCMHVRFVGPNGEIETKVLFIKSTFWIFPLLLFVAERINGQTKFEDIWMHCFLCRSSPRRWIKHVTLMLKECLIGREKTWFVLICYPPWPFDIIMQNFYKVFVILTSLLSSFSSISFVFFFQRPMQYNLSNPNLLDW